MALAIPLHGQNGSLPILIWSGTVTAVSKVFQPHSNFSVDPIETTLVVPLHGRAEGFHRRTAKNRGNSLIGHFKVVGASSSRIPSNARELEAPTTLPRDPDSSKWLSPFRSQK
ncbi:hypothetical protein J3R74_002345 [Puniceicoccus vermicola]